ncbi:MULTISPECIES: DNA-binding transcriptional regulator Fis [unclassified Psychrobacter]|uniref:DNA-binding transcriptional regulator Fis n=1 Tax=unclassified Psychrobacter TaxID=196806 RepID=UPI0009A6672B|nr:MULTISPECIES: DNA-binding transcriptional regulator Fis [unclassified Psychrobacter]OXL28485.1 Fis family transcriptional regulator [Psychrobacter sp. DAB_AL32B]SLJ85118.1 DNA-binding protein fis [Psychrobacter sp. DAB_AL43B]
MAPHVQYNASHSHKSAENPTDYYKEDYHRSNHDVKPSLESTSHTHEPLRVHVERVVRQYFAMLGDEIPTDLYELILKEIEQPLLSVVLEKSRGNQTKCAQILGLNRGTLRKKLKTYGLM